MKRILCAILALMMVLGLCACGNSSTPQETAAATIAPTEPIVEAVNYERILTHADVENFPVATAGIDYLAYKAVDLEDGIRTGLYVRDIGKEYLQNKKVVTSRAAAVMPGFPCYAAFYVLEAGYGCQLCDHEL